MFSEIMSGGSVGFFGGGLPSLNATIRVIFLVCFLVWLAKTRLWKVLFPAGVPGGIHAARWLAIVGLARVGCGGFITSVGFISAGGGRFGGQTEIQGWLPTLMVLDQLWSLAFWFTLTVLFFTTANQFLLRYLRQLESSTR